MANCIKDCILIKNLKSRILEEGGNTFLKCAITEITKIEGVTRTLKEVLPLPFPTPTPTPTPTSALPEPMEVDEEVVEGMEVDGQ